VNSIVITWRLARYIDSYVAEGALLYTLTVLTPNFPVTGYYTFASTSLVTIAFKKSWYHHMLLFLWNANTPRHTLLGIPSH